MKTIKFWIRHVTQTENNIMQEAYLYQRNVATLGIK